MRKRSAHELFALSGSHKFRSLQFVQKLHTSVFHTLIVWKKVSVQPTVAIVCD